MPNVSFDYAILEKSKNILVCPLPVSWSDVGCWDSVYDVMKKDQNQNVKYGNVLEIDTKNSLIIGGKRLISTVGLEDMLIVETDDAIFISKKGESQKVKNIVQKLLKLGSNKGITHTTKRCSWGEARLLDEGSEFMIQKILIHSGQSWKSAFFRKGHIMLLEGSVLAILDGEAKNLNLLDSIAFERDQNLVVSNSGEIDTTLLLLTNR
jgi:mannose-1-phosphate guanylyltransferase/mannose-6-phosphate isomerase